MTRVLVVGNSHSLPILEFLKTAPDEMFGGHDIQTFAAPGRIFRNLSFDAAGRFGAHDLQKFSARDLEIIKTLNDQTLSVDPGEFDRIVLLGPNVGHEELSGVMAAHDIIGVFENGRDNRITPELFDKISDTLVRTHTQGMAWRAFPFNRLIFVERARRSSACIDFNLKRDRYFTEIGLLGASCHAAFARHAATFGKAIEALGGQFVPQPETTVDETGLTAKQYSRGVPRLVAEGEYPKGDAMHMNGDYGRMIWPDILARL